MADMRDNTKKRGWETCWTKDEDDILIENYSLHGSEYVCNLLLQRSRYAVQERAKKLGLKYLVYDTEYFKSIDSPEKAYWLGFIYTDGYTSSGNRWGIELQIGDIGHMQKLLDCIKSNMRIRTRKKKSFSGKSETCCILIKNKSMHDDIVSKGVTNDKTYTLKFPSESVLPNKYLPDFIRGLYDGDGSYVFYRKDMIRKDRGNKVYNRIVKEISFVCKSDDFSRSLLEAIKSFGVEARLERNSRDDLNVIRIYSSRNMLAFINHIYNDATIYLNRKYDKAQEIKKYCLTQ